VPEIPAQPALAGTGFCHHLHKRLADGISRLWELFALFSGMTNKIDQ
jgi:hypothetical protein